MTTDEAVTPPTSKVSHRFSLVDTVLAAAAGLLSAAVALGVGQLVAVLTGPATAPVSAVDQGVVVLTPEWAKEFAIRTFGENDKLALMIGTLLLVALVAMAIGMASGFRRELGIIGIGLFGLIGAFAALRTIPNATFVVVAPSIAGGIAGAFALWWMIRRKKPEPVEMPTERTGLDRRGFLLAAGISLAVGVVGNGVGKFLVDQRYNVATVRAKLRFARPASPAPALPAGVDLKLPGLTPFSTTNSSFYRVDTAVVPPQINPADWQLRIHGMVDREMEISFAELVNRDLIERDITFTCVSNEIGGKLTGQARWLGVPLADLLREAGVRPGADQIFTTSADGWTCGTPTDAVMNTPNAMLAVGMNGEPLPVIHGFPVRMIVPGLYGYVSGTKWIVDMELTTFATGPKPYWVQRKWKTTAPIKTMARIDTPGALVDVPAGQPVAVAGMAWAQTRGIEKVEVRVNNGDWQQTELAAAANNQTWRQWWWKWVPAGTGIQSLAVRATDGTGAVQTDQRADPFPNGASGWHTVAVNVL
ncbi:molybdopterin-dependent oxidoreductase [Fodinicola feengrottensis]